MNDFNLSKHFTFFELTDSKEHPELLEENREIAQHYKDKLTRLCVSMLEPIRAKTKTRIYVSSGFRCLELNNDVNGSNNSQHMKGEAADIYAAIPSYILFDTIQNMITDGLKWHQLIHYPNQNFVHTSLPSGYDDMQIMTDLKH